MMPIARLSTKWGIDTTDTYPVYLHISYYDAITTERQARPGAFALYRADA
jgi:hypothetical protein